MKKFTVLGVFVLAASLFAPFSGQAAGFNDVSSGYTFSEEVDYLSSEQIITGFTDGTFKPNNVVTRAQAAIMIGKALNLNGDPKNTTFSDVTSNVTGSGYIASAAERGIISGYTDKTYRPNEPVTRGQMAIFLDRAFELTTSSNNIFNDVSSNMAAYQSIIDVASNGIASGYSDGTYRPDQPVNRGQFAAFMARTLEPSFRSMAPMVVKFLDVGQGDAIFIQYPNNETALIDAGRSDAAISAALKAENITQIDTFIATHPDADHIGGADYVIKNYGVTKVIDSGQTHTTQTYTDYLSTVDAVGAEFVVAQIGNNVSDDSNVSADVLFVDSDASDLNDGSIVIMLSYGLTDILLTGDAGLAVEDYLMANNYDLDAEVLKVSHHGSNTSTSGDFIEAVSPQDAILSYGENQYGHPHDEVVSDLMQYGVDLYSTFEQGTVTLNSIGNSYSINVNPVQWEKEPDPKPIDPGNGGQTTNQIQITAKDLSTDVVTIKNNGSSDVNMTGWTLYSVTGDQSYTFPDGFILRAGASVNITAGPNAIDNPPSSLKWTGSYIWNNSGDAAQLYDPNGTLIHQIN